jgi:hypothetical protein
MVVYYRYSQCSLRKLHFFPMELPVIKWGKTSHTSYISELLYLIKETSHLPMGNTMSLSALAACDLEWHFSFSFHLFHIIASVTYFRKPQVHSSKFIGNNLYTEVTIFLTPVHFITCMCPQLECILCELTYEEYTTAVKKLLSELATLYEGWFYTIQPY